MSPRTLRMVGLLAFVAALVALVAFFRFGPG
ncbi:hypothetical protein [Planktothrix phage Pra-JY27]|nr:hypothetical protein [Planktothrix phage Pag-Yong1]WEV89204.1 hypothetical protein [Synechococcus phage MinM2]